MMACDFNGDGGISATDATPVYKAAPSKNPSLLFDLNGDGGISATDATIVYACASGSNYYNGLEIK